MNQFLLHNWRRYWLSVLICGASGFALFFLWDVFGVARDLPAQVQALGLNSRTWIPFIAYFALANPFIEEYFWRGYLGNDSRSIRWNDFLYAGFHALILFGRVHPLSNMFAVAALTIAGWFWRQVKRKDNGLLAPVLGHMAADLTILLAICLKTN
ncbi:MAG: CPBP family intramembrane metalloprotease [Anaerolineales bacterium]|nr:CPBP family intramembrane metalloprotease [Anaerolineales bacterium]